MRPPTIRTHNNIFTGTDAAALNPTSQGASGSGQLPEAYSPVMLPQPAQNQFTLGQQNVFGFKGLNKNNGNLDSNDNINKPLDKHPKVDNNHLHSLDNHGDGSFLDFKLARARAERRDLLRDRTDRDHAPRQDDLLNGHGGVSRRTSSKRPSETKSRGRSLSPCTWFGSRSNSPSIATKSSRRLFSHSPVSYTRADSRLQLPCNSPPGLKCQRPEFDSPSLRKRHRPPLSTVIDDDTFDPRFVLNTELAPSNPRQIIPIDMQKSISAPYYSRNSNEPLREDDYAFDSNDESVFSRLSTFERLPLPRTQAHRGSEVSSSAISSYASGPFFVLNPDGSIAEAIPPGWRDKTPPPSPRSSRFQGLILVGDDVLVAFKRQKNIFSIILACQLMVEITFITTQIWMGLTIDIATDYEGGLLFLLNDRINPNYKYYVYWVAVGIDLGVLIVYYVIALWCITSMKTVAFRLFEHFAFFGICLAVIHGMMNPFFLLVFLFRIFGYQFKLIIFINFDSRKWFSDKRFTVSH